MSNRIERQSRSEKEPKPSLDGINMGNGIWLGRLGGAKLIRTYFHEVGHFLSRRYSFENGEVLSPDEVKKLVPEFEFDYKSIYESLYPGEDLLGPKSTNKVIKFGNQLLKIYAKGKFNWWDVILRTDVPENHLQELDELFNGKGSPDEEGVEIAAIATETACVKLADKSIKRHFRDFKMAEPDFSEPAYIGALQIVRSAYCSVGQRFCSEKDLELKRRSAKR